MNPSVPSFRDLNLPGKLQKAIDDLGFKAPTPIQVEAIPAGLMDRDLIATAQTGTGKTAAFCIPMLTKLEKNSAKAALIIVPTREIALQIGGVLMGLSKYLHGLLPATVVGGMPMNTQVRILAKNPRIIIATPGRLVDHLKRRTVSLSRIDMLILDEADRMLDMGFAAQIKEILRFVPQTRQTLLFSATMPTDIQQLASKILKNPERIAVGPVSKPIEEIKQASIQTTQAQKSSVLMDELKSREGSVLIFARTKHRTDRLAKQLTAAGHQVNRLHGGRSQGQRNSAINGFRLGKFRILVATDIAARGIDIPHIAHVINYDLPMTVEDYVHRIGRTARAGADGNALSFVTPEDRSQWKEISRKFI